MSDDALKKYEEIMKIGFGGLEAIDEEIIEDYGKVFQKGEFIIKEGEKSNDVYLILEGKVIVTKDVNTIKKVLAVLGPGELVGEMSFFESTTRSASCIADDTVTTIKFNYDTFSEIYRVHTRWLMQILESMSNRIIKTLELIKEKSG
jgi:CRP-like cAMP-binding protein